MENLMCALHPLYNIISICETCNNNHPVCLKCITNVHKGHIFKDIEDIDIKNSIISDYYNNTLPQLDSILDIWKSKLEKSDNHFKQIEDKHNNNLTQLVSKFNMLRNLINAKEFDLKRQLITNLDENIDINSNNSTICNNIITNINNIKNDNNKNNNDDDNNNNLFNENQLITILKRNYQCKLYAKTTDSDGLEEYKDIELKILINSIMDHIETQTKIFDSCVTTKSLKDKNGEYRWDSDVFQVYENGDDISKITHSKLAINYGNQLPPSFPITVVSLLLPNNFDQPLDSLPSHIKGIFIFNIKLQLKQNTIPKSIEYVILDGGFSQKLNNGVIPDNVKIIYLGDTLNPIEADAVSNPSSVIVYKTSSHKHIIPSCYTCIRNYYWESIK